MDKRQFLHRMGQATLAAPLMALPTDAIAAPQSEVRNPGPYPQDDETAFWKRVRMDYALKPDYVNLENGYYNMVPIPILDQYLKHIRQVNYEASYYMRTVQWENKDRVKNRLAQLVGCNPEHLAITRNTTESLDLVIGGFPWKKNDEAVFALQDYGAMRNHFRQMEQRYGMVCKEVSVPNHPLDDEALVDLYAAAITPKTRLLMICHMINITGQILPVRKICDMAHDRGVQVLVDGAHCIGHIAVDLEALGCDYYGSSLHKWLSVPLGAGLLYVKPNHIGSVWPLLADSITDPTDIRRLNHTGTHPVHTDLAIEDAIDYLEILNLGRKERRLRYLQRYWSDRLRGTPGIVVNTPEDPNRSCGIANVGIPKMAPRDLARTLLEEFRIWTVAIDHPKAGVQGCRITPNVYTTTDELDQFVTAMETLASRT